MASNPSQYASTINVGGTGVTGTLAIANGGTGATTAAAALAALGGLVKQASNATAGYSLINGTGAITGATWTAPSDGNPHYVFVAVDWSVTVGETGGAATSNYTAPDGNVGVSTFKPGSQGTGRFTPNGPQVFVIQAGSTFTLQQSTALTVGTTVLWYSIWGL